MTTTTLRRPPGRPGTPVTSAPAGHPLTVPRTSATAPWDRLRFSATTTRGAEEAEAAAASTDAPLPEPGPWAGALVRAAVEVLVGSRPAAQLARWCTAELYDSLARRAGLAVRILGRPAVVHQARVQRVLVCPVRPDVYEAAVVVHDGNRVRAAAVRLEAHRGRWRATALEIG
ncbi:Rv3235 family protein [Georgenia faecalis]|uniref:Rv3235 family protein n=1 Tax=Georgenia faecalis TaxID=2483799 RepID=UPI000FDBAE68|nr:Rv3235 family protein [Georgenia faecalis]